MSTSDESRLVKSADKLHAGLVRAPSPESQRWAEPLVARLANETWRLRRRLTRIDGAVDETVFRPLLDSISRLEDVFAEYQVQTLEHEGQAYDAGLQVEVLHAREGDGDAVILETIRPTVLLKGQVLQQGQVVIGPAVSDGDRQ